MGQIQLQAEQLERRVQEYKNDTFIKGCISQITRILERATPIAEMDLKTGEVKFDIDDKSKEWIKYWHDKVAEYVVVNYPEIKRTNV